MEVNNNDINNNDRHSKEDILRVEEIVRVEKKNMIKIHRSCENCNIEFQLQLSNAISKEHSNPLNNFCETCYVNLIQNNNSISEVSKNLRNNQKPKERKITSHIIEVYSLASMNLTISLLQKVNPFVNRKLKLITKEI